MPGKPSLSDKVFSALRWTAAARLITQIVSWAATIVTARLLSPDDYGLVALASLVVGYFATLSDFGFGSALIRQPDVTDEQIVSIDSLLLLLGTAVSIAVILSANWVASALGDERASLFSQVLSIQCFLSAATVVPMAKLSREMRFDTISRIALISGFSATVVTFSSAYAGLGAWALAAGSTSEVTIRTVLLRVRTRRWGVSLPRLGIVRPYFIVSKWIIGEKSLWYWYAQADIFIIGRVLGAVQLGWYSMAKQLASIPVDKLVGPLNQVALPAFASVQSQSDELASYALKVFRLGLAYSLPVFWGLAAIGPLAVQVLLGSKWDATGQLLSIVSIALPLRVITALWSTCLTAIGRPDLSFRNRLVAIVVVPIAVGVGSVWGVTGAAWGYAVGTHIAGIQLIWNTAALLGIRISWLLRDAWPTIISAFGMSAATYGCWPAIAASTNDVMALCISVVMGALVYALLMLATGKHIALETAAFFGRLLR